MASIAGMNMSVNAIAVDALDNIYVAGSGNAAGIPGLDRGYDATPDGVDAFIGKIDRNGSIVWATYLGGTDRRVPGSRVTLTLSDSARAIAVDAAGQVYVAGVTGADNFPIVGAFQHSRLGDTDAFVAKLSADGRRLLYSSYIGSTGESMSAHGIAVGAAGEAWINALSPQGRFLTTRDLSDAIGRRVILKLNPAGSPVWSARVALTNEGGFAVDGAGRAHAAGARCPTLPDCRYVLLRLDPSGTRVEFSTSFANDNAWVHRSDLALLPNGRVAFSGVASGVADTLNAWVQHTPCWPAPRRCNDAFVAIVDASGRIETTSYLGVGETASILAADQFGRVTVAASTQRIDLTLARPLVDHHVDGPIYISRDRGTTFDVEGRKTLPIGAADDLTFNWRRNDLYTIANGIFESNEQINTWRLDSQAGFGTDDWYRIAVDRRNPAIRYAIFGDHVLRHDEGSVAWRMISRSVSGFYRRTVVVSPHDSSVWIAGNAGVATSADGGATWIDRSAGLPNLRGSSSTVEHLDFDPQRAGVVYAMTQVGLYVTLDHGATWEHLTGSVSPPPSTRAIAFDPISASTLHVATLNHGVLTSRDGGRTWARTLEGHRITVVQTDHMKRHIVYAGGLDAEGRPTFYRSIDFARTWHRAGDGLHMRGEPSRLIVDPRDSSNVYISSAAFEAAPYLMRVQTAPADPRRTAIDFATYLGHGQVRAMAATVSGGLVVALNHTWPSSNLSQQQIVTVRIGS